MSVSSVFVAFTCAFVLFYVISYSFSPTLGSNVDANSKIHFSLFSFCLGAVRLLRELRLPLIGQIEC